MANTDNSPYQENECNGSQCVNWTGVVNNQGYGLDRIGDAITTAHRVAWIKAFGPIPDKYDVDHLCRNRLCVNLDHLEPVPHRENMHRIPGWPKMHCPRGHPLDGDNLYIQIQNGSVNRSCRVCRNERSRRRS